MCGAQTHALLLEDDIHLLYGEGNKSCTITTLNHIVAMEVPRNGESLLANFDAVLKLLKGRSCEERVAGLVISSKTFDKLQCSMDSAQIEEVLSRIISAVSVKFIIRMLMTTVDATDGQMTATAVHVMRVAAGYPSLASKFLPYSAIIVDKLIVKEVGMHTWFNIQLLPTDLFFPHLFSSSHFSGHPAVQC